MGVDQPADDPGSVPETIVSTPTNDMPVNVRNINIAVHPSHSGVTRTRDELITNQLERLFDCQTLAELKKKVNLCEQKLQRLGIFKDIDTIVSVSADGVDPNVDISFDVTEMGWQRGSVGCNTSMETVKSVDGNVKLGLSNLFGRGESALVNYYRDVLSSSHLFDLSLSMPWMKNSDCSLTLKAFRSIKDFTTWSLFKETALGVGADLSLQGSLGVNKLSYDFSWRENTIAPSAPFEIREHCGHSLKSSVGYSFISDGRNDWVFPSQGHYFRYNAEFSGLGGDVNVLKSDVEFQLNKELATDYVLTAGFHAGAARSLSASPLHINERYFLGGPTSLRGFRDRGVGRHADQASLGGDVFWETGLHLHTPLPFLNRIRTEWHSWANLFHLHFFANAGNLNELANVSSVKDVLVKPRMTLGVGLSILFLHAYRLELNYCLPTNARPGDQTNPGCQFGIGIHFL